MKKNLFWVIPSLLLFGYAEYKVYNIAQKDFPGTVIKIEKSYSGSYFAIIDFDEYGETLINFGAYNYLKYSPGDRYTAKTYYIPLVGLYDIHGLPDNLSIWIGGLPLILKLLFMLYMIFLLITYLESKMSKTTHNQ